MTFLTHGNFYGTSGEEAALILLNLYLRAFYFVNEGYYPPARLCLPLFWALDLNFEDSDVTLLGKRGANSGHK